MSLQSKSEQLKLKVKTLPTSPGVYMFKDADGKLIYIGKAKNLRNRVRTYFQSATKLDPKTARMVARATGFDMIATDNEIESLILEANLVREHKPRYNILLKDDKHFPYIKITAEPFPRLVVVRRLERDKATYFGPYTSAKSMRRTFALLTRLFKIRSCKLVIPAPEGKKHKVCLDYHIGLCKAPCVGRQSRENYADAINSVKMVLLGKSNLLIEQLATRMQAASEALEFETAKESRDQIDAIKAVHQRQNVDVGELIDRDIISFAREKSLGVAVVMQIREGALIGRQDFQMTAEVEDADEFVLEGFLTQYYHAQPNLPEEVHLPLDWPGRTLVGQWLKRIKGSKIKTVVPAIGDKSKLVRLAQTNARMLLDELLIQRRHQSERTSKMVSALKDDLKLSSSPRTMVCFDISNTGETDAVGSCVYFENSKPKKSEYRLFKIKEITSQDDFKMMREVIGRYFHRLTKEEKPPPDLVVVDGGKGQLSTALAELRVLGFADQPIIGLAKRLEEVFVPGQSDPISIPRSSPSLMLLKQIRDEAHRFAITYNRKVRTKRTIKSVLDDIPGVGPAKRNMLLKKFGSVAKIKKLTLEQLIEVKGISPKLAAMIYKSLK